MKKCHEIIKLMMIKRHSVILHAMLDFSCSRSIRLVLEKKKNLYRFVVSNLFKMHPIRPCLSRDRGTLGVLFEVFQHLLFLSLFFSRTSIGVITERREGQRRQIQAELELGSY